MRRVPPLFLALFCLALDGWEAAYGGYAYFGGDEAFGAAKEEVLAGLGGGGISASKLGTRLRDALAPVVRDGHFSINGHTFIGDYKQYMYYVPSLWFDDLTGLDMDYVKPTIGPDGALTYCFAAIAAESRELPQSAVVEGKETALDWTRAGLYQTEGRERVVCRRTSRGGVAVLESRTLAAGADEEIQQELERFAAAGEEYRGLPALIVDIRGNGGGNDGYPKAWLDGFTGTEVQPKEAGGTNYSPLFFACVTENDLYASMREYFLAQTQKYLGTAPFHIQDGVFTPNETITFVLADGGTGSAGEGFMTHLSSVDNVVFVGGNTYGSIMFGNVMELWLPHSGIGIRMGSKLNFYGSLENIEGRGFLPDLWVPPSDALDAVSRLIKYYGLA